MKTLVIVESPAKCKTIQKYLGKDYIVKASFGHVRDLPNKEMGIDTDNDFRPKYVVDSSKTKVVKELQGIAKTVDRILLASDPDREGEAIAWHLENLLQKHCSNIGRIVFNEITKKSVQQAVQNPSTVDLDMVNSQQARRMLDRLVGYSVSPWLSQVLRGKLSAGRVQSVSLRIIVDRDREIKNFVPEEYWKIHANLTPFQEEFPFDSELFQKQGKKIERIKNKQEADSILDDLNGQFYTVDSVERKERKKKPAAPFTTSTLQQEGSRKLKWDSSKTMKVAQELYEGVELQGGNAQGLITYMRTDSTRISGDFQNDTLDYIGNNWGKNYTPDKPNEYKTKGDAQDAHEAIRPTNYDFSPDDIRQYLTPDQYKLYDLIWKRYIASQMAHALYDTLTVLIEAGQYTFKSTGSTLRFDGFMTLYMEDKDSDDDNNDDNEIQLPNLSKGEQLNLIKLNPKQSFTKPPAPYTEATLIKALEKEGVGRPSTYASIISTLKNRRYVEVNRSKFEPTELGNSVIDILVEWFTDLMEVKFTAEMEGKLDTIADGKEYWVSVLDDFYNPFAKTLEKARMEVKPMEREEVLSDQNCPDCGKQMAIKEGKFGKFLGCTGYPDCKKIMPFFDESTPSIDCDQCNSKMILREVKKGRKKEYFYGCVNYPTCKNTVPSDKKGTVKDKPKVEESDKKCEKCGESMLIREGKNGKFYACSGYPDCKNTEPYIDENQKTMECDQCGKDMVHRKGKFGYFYGCSGYPTCKNIKNADKDGNLVEKEKTKVEETDKKCPNCGKSMYLREGKTGKFYGCSGYPKCKTTLPHGETKECNECGKPMVKRKGAKGEFWGCTGYPTCSNTMEA